MKIKWYGHACFKLSYSENLNVVTDPFDDHVGYPLCETEADIVTTSHGHGDHNYTESIKGKPAVLNRAGMFAFDDLTVRTVKTFHDGENGERRGKNLIFIFEAEGLKIAHLGDLGHEPDEDQYAALAGIDVMMIPIGGYYTINTGIALKIVENVKPKLVIPMHFNTEVMNFPITDEEQFAKETGAKYWDSTEIEVTYENIDSLPNAVVLKYKD